MSRSMNGDTLMYMGSTLGSYVRDRREALGINQTELSERAGVPRTTVNRLETGTTQLPSPDIRRRLAVALGVSHLDLLVAAGEITSAEIGDKAGVVDRPEDDPVEQLVERIRALPRSEAVLQGLSFSVGTLEAQFKSLRHQ